MSGYPDRRHAGEEHGGDAKTCPRCVTPQDGNPAYEGCPARDSMHFYRCQRPLPHADYHEVDTGWAGPIRWDVGPRSHRDLSDEALHASINTARLRREQLQAELARIAERLTSLNDERLQRGGLLPRAKPDSPAVRP